jgi:hypothetical protein
MYQNFLGGLMWRDVVGYEDFYEVSSIGEVKSKTRIYPGRGGYLCTRKPRIMTQGVTTKGYFAVTLTLNGVERRIEVHRLVAEAFLGKPDGMQVNHKDGIKKNNKVENLEWVTPSENSLHAFRMGLRVNNFVK